MYERIVAAALEMPWAITDDKARAIGGLLATWHEGEKFSAAEVRERIAAGRPVCAPMWFVGDDGKEYRDTRGACNCSPDEGHHEPNCAALQVTSAQTAARSAKSKLVAVIPVYGVIMQRMSMFDEISGGASVEVIAKQLRAAAANPEVKAIVMDFDSPGGSVYGVDELAQEIFDAAQQKKIVAQVNPLAASAAYYLASQASEIAMLGTGEVGSIGVRMMHADYSEALKQKGIKVTHVFAGDNKVEGNQYEPLGEDAKAFMQQRVDEYYQMFVKAVARGRDTTVKAVNADFGQGRVFGAEEAKQRGMIDRVSTMEQTLERLGVSADGNRVALAAESSAPAVTAQQDSAEVVAEQESDSAGSPAGVSSDGVLAKPEITAEAENHGGSTMSTTISPAAAAGNAVDAMLAAETIRIEALRSIAALHNSADKLAGWLTNKTTVEAAQAEIMESYRSSARPVHQPSAEVVSEPVERMDKTLALARLTMACTAAKRFGTKGEYAWAGKVLKDPGFLRIMALDGQQASDFASGGFMISESPLTEFIALLRPKSVVRSFNPGGRPLINGSYNFGKVTSGPTAQYQGESGPIKSSGLKGGQVKATTKKLTVMVPIENDLLRFAGPVADATAREEMIKAVAQTEDLAFIRYAGTVNTPKGLRYWALAANVLTPQATINLANTFKDLGSAELAIGNSNIPMTNMGWIMSKRSEYYLKYLALDSLGNRVFLTEMLTGKLLGHPYKTTTQIPNNLADVSSGVVGSEIYLVDFDQVVICDAPQIGVEVSGEASYVDSTGATVSAWTADQTVIRMIVEHDLVVKYPEAIAVLNGMTWGN